MSFADMSVLPLSREAVTVETFVDDTYQSFLGGPDERMPNQQPPVVSEDGANVLFSVASTRALSDDAGRVFVRGALRARVARGAPRVDSQKLELNVGRQVKVGPFEAVLKSISDAGRASHCSPVRLMNM